jgi:hypothetical protein
MHFPCKEQFSAVSKYIAENTDIKTITIQASVGYFIARIFTNLNPVFAVVNVISYETTTLILNPILKKYPPNLHPLILQAIATCISGYATLKILGMAISVKPFLILFVAQLKMALLVTSIGLVGLAAAVALKKFKLITEDPIEFCIKKFKIEDRMPFFLKKDEIALYHDPLDHEQLDHEQLDYEFDH